MGVMSQTMGQNEKPVANFRRQMLKAAFAGMLVLPGLAACGFQPLYGTLGGGQVKQRLAAVEVATIPGRVGQKVRNELIFGLTGGSQPTASDYRLEIILRESQSSSLVEITGKTTRHIYKLQAEYKLVDLASGNELFKAKATSQAPYDRVDSGFANVRARIDAENRTATIIAENIKTRVAAFLSRSS